MQEEMENPKVDLMMEALESLDREQEFALAYELGAGDILELLAETIAENLHEMALNGRFDDVTTPEEAVAALKKLM